MSEKNTFQMHYKGEFIKASVTFKEATSQELKKKMDLFLQLIEESEKEEKPVDNQKEISSTSASDRPLIRNRIPNRKEIEEQEVINLKDLNVQPGYQLENNFRCPACGQSAVLQTHDGIVLVRNIVDGDELYQVKPGVRQEGKTLSYSTACACSLPERVSLVSSDETEAECLRCLHKVETSAFVDAYKNPLKYFETEERCPLCGDEMCYVQTSTGQTLACENPECSYEIPVKKE